MPRQKNNSVFVDDSFRPYPDQWQLLASVQRIQDDQVEWIVNDASRRGQVIGVRIALTDPDEEDEPWTMPPSKRVAEMAVQGPFPECVELVQSNLIYIPKSGIPEAMLNRLIRLAAFQNPEFYKAQSMRLSTWDKPRIIFCGEDCPQHVAIAALIHRRQFRGHDRRMADSWARADVRASIRPAIFAHAINSTRPIRELALSQGQAQLAEEAPICMMASGESAGLVAVNLNGYKEVILDSRGECWRPAQTWRRRGRTRQECPSPEVRQNLRATGTFALPLGPTHGMNGVVQEPP